MAGPPRAPLIYKEAAELIASLGLPIAPVSLAERGAFHHATARGLTASELEPQSKAAHEVEALWMWTCEQLNMTAREHVQVGMR